jgi:hypothetical protein
MKIKLITSLLAVTFSTASVSSDKVNLVITQEDGSRKNTSVLKDNLSSFKELHSTALIEEDVIVNTRQILPQRKAHRGAVSPKSYVLSKSAATPDYLPNDEYFGEQVHWQAPNEQFLAYNNILSSVRQLSPLRRPVVGVVDSGFYQHPDLQYADGYSFTRVVETQRKEYFFVPEEFNGSPEERTSNCFVHGTGVAGIAVATRDNNIGFAGIADADLVVARSMYCGLGYLSDTSDSMLWQLGLQVDDIRPPVMTVDVINLSLGGEAETCPSYLQSAIDAANEQSVPVVVAIGNQQIDASGYSPSNCSGVINVAAASREGDLFRTSNFGTQIDIAALGDNVAGMTEDPQGIGYWEESSFAAPIVTGVVANALSEFGTLSLSEIKFFMSATASPFAPGQCDDSNRCGAGILDAEKFHLALRDFRAGEVVVLKPALNNTQFCDKALYVTDEEELTRLCATMELTLPVHQSDRDDIRFEIFAFEKGQGMAFENGSLVLSTQSSRLLTNSLNPGENDFGVRMCNSERCYGESAIKVTDRTTNLPEICN